MPGEEPPVIEAPRKRKGANANACSLSLLADAMNGKPAPHPGRTERLLQSSDVMQMLGDAKTLAELPKKMEESYEFKLPTPAWWTDRKNLIVVKLDMSQLKVWPHDNNEVYEAFNRIFSCQGHGWSNLQSMHINLPFANDDEFGRLHAAIRLVLPLIHGLAASSPLVEGRLTGTLDNRLDAYRTNCARIPSVTGLVVPEAVYSPESYEQQILQVIYRDLALLDPDGVLAHEWVNARGAIARFDRMAIEIRTADTQECPKADLAIAELVIAVVRSLVDELHSQSATQKSVDTELLARFHQDSVKRAGAATWPTREYLALFGIDRERLSVRETWAHLAAELLPQGPSTKERDAALQVIFDEGTLAERITGALNGTPGEARQRAVYHRLAECLAQGTSFQPYEL